jgi:hypothetical protein
MEQLGSSWTDFHKNLSTFRISVEKMQVSLTSYNNNGYFTWRPIYIFDHILFSSSYNGKYFRQKLQKKSKSISCSLTFFFENRAVYEIMWKNNVQLAGQRWQYGACTLHAGIHKSTNTHSEYVILIDFPQQQWLHERASMLRYTYIACLLWMLTFWRRNFF